MLNKNFRDVKNQWDEAAKTEYFRDYIAQNYNEEDAFRKIGKESIDNLINFLQKYNIDLSDKKIVELGCGAGRETEFLSKICKEIIALDISAEMLNRFRQRLGQIQNVKLGCIIRDFSIIEDLYVDMIYSVLTLQHNPEDMVERIFQDGHRILKPNGLFIFQIPLANEHKVVPCEGANAVDMVYWTLEEIKELATKYRYEIINDISNKINLFIFKKK
jgi:SAM-dependent methyltransferase